ncbi:coiled-coil-helix-coiled-coil-helix domain containing 4b [Osmerus mordax]|uniref:coiled-coil-helix-coiled-coil-helix domain containing 4b n=1 Tax=Osmerus mordax TaxID=8014 RepID=UPI00351095D3
MSSIKEEGKDRIIFVTKEEHETPSSAELIEEDPNDPYEERGLILPSGEINWNCPCLGGMASGPCGTTFKDAFSCFHYSKEEVKGSDCLEQFKGMQECMQRYPELYPQEDEKKTQGGADKTQPSLQDSSTDPTTDSEPTTSPERTTSPEPTTSPEQDTSPTPSSPPADTTIPLRSESSLSG